MTVGFALCGSFCTFQQVCPVMERLASEHKVIPIFSPVVCTVNSRFGTAAGHIQRATDICGMKPLMTIQEAEPIGPKKMLDALIIAPCTGNTLAKLACGITDTSVTMAAKAHLRNDRPLVIAVSTNDALSGSAKNIGDLLNRKNVYFVPMRQDDPVKKPRSIVAEMELIPEAIREALAGRQIQPIIKS